MEKISDMQAEAMEASEAQKVANLQTTSDMLMKHAEGIPNGLFDAGKIAISSEEANDPMERAKLMGDLHSRANLALRRVQMLHGNRKTSPVEILKYKEAKGYFNQLDMVRRFLTSFNVSNAFAAQLIQKVSDSVQVDYENEMVMLVDKQAKDIAGSNSKVVTDPSTNPDVIEIEKNMKEEFGVEVNFGDNIILGQQTYKDCKEIKSRGHKLPNRIIFFEAEKKENKGVFVSVEGFSFVLISTTDLPVDLDRDGRLVVDSSCRGTLLHEIGHVNSEEDLSKLPEFEDPEFSEKFKKYFSFCIAKLIEELPGSKNVLQELINVIRDETEIDTIMNMCSSKLSLDETDKFYHIIASNSDSFVKELNGLRKQIAEEVSLYAATSESEFMAEVYCGCMLGKTYSSEIMDVYKKLGGQPFK
ncbi:MAG: hypothetical protein LBC11_01310 [Puniceicoccales bacterium]|jgi:hypothetical protein|nr:hypothetical protein [Puniceicoccales bacterium]